MSLERYDKIGESELIISPNGAVYHLNLKPDELADTIITVGDPDRVKEVSKHFDSIEHKAQHREFVTHTGYIGSKRLSVVSTGIGTDNIDIVLNEIDALHNIDFEKRVIKPVPKQLTIIRLGTCGSLQRDIPVDSLVASSFAVGLDNLLHYYQHKQNPEEQFILNELQQQIKLQKERISPYIFEGSIHLRAHFSEGFKHGITITCPGFFAPQGRSLRAKLTYPNLLDGLSSFSSRGHNIANFEMETSALYGLSRILKHNCISISTVIANRISRSFSEEPEQAIETMILKALPLIEKI